MTSFNAPKRSLSQNFLSDSKISEKIASAANVKPNECIFEIGPGRGALTEKLLSNAPRLVAIEKDTSLAAYLKEKFPLAEVHEGDCLDLPLKEMLKEKLSEGEKAKIIANIPYHITTDLLKKIIECRDYLSEAVLMVQKEVAEKLYRPKPSERSFSQAFIRSYTDIELLFEVKRDSFFPKPNVDSAIIRLDFGQKKAIDNDFLNFLKKLFQQKKKQILSILSHTYSKDEAAFALAHFKIDSSTRPIALDEAILQELFYFLEKRPLK